MVYAYYYIPTSMWHVLCNKTRIFVEICAMSLIDDAIQSFISSKLWYK